MATTTPRTHRYGLAALALATFILVLLAAATTPTHAQAAETPAANYALGVIAPAGGAPLTRCRSWSGDADSSGHFYMACPSNTNPYIYELDERGTILRGAALPANYLYDQTYRMRDVAAAPDGKTLFVSMGPIIDNVGQNPGLNLQGGALRGSILKLVRQADGSWAHDPTFVSGPYKLGDNYWSARYLDVDASGRVYAAVNAYIYELNPATGAVVGAFGGATTNGKGGTWASGIDVPQGVAVAADGNSMFIVEQRFHILQRWVRTGGGWQRDATWGPNGNGLLGVASEEGAQYCATTNHFQSPYDVGVDAAGDIYVTDVSCRRIQRFNKNGAFIQTVWSNGPDGELNHGFAVNWQGSIVLPELERTLLRRDPPVNGGGGTVPDAPAKPACTDSAAPKITSVTVNATSATRELTFTAAGSDDCSGAANIKVSGDIVGAAGWSANLTQTVRLRGWNGPKMLTIVIRDGKQRVSTSVRRRVTLALPQPTLVARTKTSIAGSGCAKVAPSRRISGNYLVLDRCARLTGVVRQVQKTSNGYAVQVELPAGAAQLLYTNAVGSVKVWLVTDRLTRVRRSPKINGKVVFVGTLVSERNRSAVHAIPIDVLT